jgi:hypothetical protein
MVSST